MQDLYNTPTAKRLRTLRGVNIQVCLKKPRNCGKIPDSGARERTVGRGFTPFEGRS